MQRNLFFLACFTICANCFAQQYPFVYYTPKDGLVNSRVRSIKQDSKGRMYFITYGGLSIYDGTRFINYSEEDGLANELVNDVLEVAPDSILVATNTQKLNMLVRNRLGTFQTGDSVCPVINRLHKSKEGDLYAAADEGLFILKHKCFKPLPLTNTRGKTVGLYLDKIVEWGHFLFLIPWSQEENEKLILFDKITEKAVDVFTSERVFSISVDLSNKVWMTTPKGIQILDTGWLSKGKMVLRDLPEAYKEIAGLKNCYVFFDPYGSSWFYSGNRIIRFDHPDMLREISSKQGLTASGLLDLYRDREGNLWMASDGNGVIKMKGTDVQLVTGFFADTTSYISAMLHVADTFWFFNATANMVHRVYQNKITSFSLGKNHMRVDYMYVSNKHLYLCSAREMICIRDKDDRSAYLRPRFVLKSDVHFLTIGNGIKDPNGCIILSLQRDLNSYVSVLKNDTIIMEYPLAIISDQMTIDHKGNLWIVSRDNHVMVFSLHKDQPAQYLQLLHDYQKGLPVTSPRSIALDQLGNVWVGTRYHGVFQFRNKNDKLIQVAQYTTHNGLTDNFAYFLHCGDSNTIWVGTQTGLDKIFLKKGKFIIGNVSKNNNFFQSIRRVLTDNGHSVWALTGEGSVIKIAGSTYFPTSPAPALLLSSVLVNNKTYDGPLDKFSHDQNNFTFSFAAPSFVDEKSIRYSYRLEGSSSNDWSPPSTNATFNFIALAPGKYTLTVRANFPEALYDTQYLHFSFTILEPWWGTWWFRSLIVLFIVGIALLIIRNYYHQKLVHQKHVLEKKQVVEKERTRIASDMHDDLGAGLSRIKFLSQTIGIKIQKELSVEDDVTKIRKFSDEMINKMGEIVWALNEKHDSLNDLMAYTRAYAVQYLEQNGIDCIIEGPDDFPANFVSGEFRRNIFLAVKEILHNVVKHAQATTVKISIEANDQLVLSIHDDGTGFNPSHIVGYHNGLINISRRMKDIGGTMQLENRRGTLLILKAPFEADHKEQG